MGFTLVKSILKTKNVKLFFRDFTAFFRMCSLRDFFSLFFRLLIIFQLIFIPQYSIAQQSMNHPMFTPQEIENDERKRKIQESNEEIESLREMIFSDKINQEHSLDIFSLLTQKVEKGIKKIEVNAKEEEEIKGPYFRYVNPKNINIEITNKDKEVINQFNRKSEERSFVSLPDSENQFQISYKGKVLHTFDHSIKWIALLNNYIVFLQPGKTFKDRAHLSFIDLNYFSIALGQTTLPFFKIPIEFSSETDAESIEQAELSISKQGLTINSNDLSYKELDFFAKFQQMIFSVTVSLVDPETYTEIRPILQNIIDSYTSSFERENKDLIETFDDQKKKSYKELSKIMETSLSIIRKRGSADDITGPYGQLEGLKKDLEGDNSHRKVMEIFSEHLEKDKDFQATIRGHFANREQRQKFFSRALILFSRMIAPQPLGSPKIRTALGMIAGSMSPRFNKNAKEDSLSRKNLFKKGLKDFVHNKKTRVTASLLAGIGLGMTHPETASMIHEALSMVVSRFSEIGDLLKATWDSMTSFASLSEMKEVYISDGKWLKLLVGIAALVGIFLATIVGVLHFSINSYHYVRSFTNSKVNRFRDFIKEFFRRKNFTEHMNKERSLFVDNLAAAELRKMGLSVSIILSNGTFFKGLYRTTQSWKKFLPSFQYDEISLFFESPGKLPLNLRSLKPYEKTDKEKITLSINASNFEKIERTFEVFDGYLEDFFPSKNTPDFKEDLSDEKKTEDKDSSMEGQEVSLTIKHEELVVKGSLINAEISKEDDIKIKELLASITSNKKTEKEKEFSSKEIKTLKRALAHFLIGYSSWQNTFYVLGKIWNKFFIGRNFTFHPLTVLTIISHPRYFKRTYTNKVRATEWNGGLSPFSFRIIRKSTLFNKILRTSSDRAEGIKTELERLKEFEEKIILIEKRYFKEASKLALLFVIKQFANDPRVLKTIRTGVPSNPYVLKGKLALTYRLVQDELMRLLMTDYLKERLGEAGLSPSEVKQEFVKNLDQKINFPEESREKIKARVDKISKAPDFEKTIKGFVYNLGYSFKREAVKHFMGVDKVLDPKQNLTMGQI